MTNHNSFPGQLTWTSGAAPSTVIAMVGSSGNLQTSNDGVTWTQQTLVLTGVTWQAVAWSPSLNLFAACGSNTSGPTAFTYSDSTGTTWNVGTGPATLEPWHALTWCSNFNAGSGFFVGTAIGLATNCSMTSPDGVNWTNHNLATSVGSSPGSPGIAYSLSLNRAVAVGTTSLAGQTSTNGTSWANTTADTSSVQANAIAWSDALAIYVVVSTNACRYSTTGTSGSFSNGSGLTGNFRAVTWSPSLALFCAVGTSGVNATSTDGHTWTTGTAISGAPLINSLCWSASLGMFIACGGTGVVYTSTDGTTFTSRTGAVSDTWTCIACTG